MIKNQKGFTGLEVVLLIVVTALIVGGGVYAYTQRTNADDQKKESVESSNAKSNVETKSDEELILEAAKCDSGVECNIENKNATLAHVVASGEGGGGHIYLAKENSSWKIIFEGNGDVPAETVNKYYIPSDWLGPQL